MPQLARSTAIADSCDTIDTVTQDTSKACPPSHGALSAMNVESLSAINGMRILDIEGTIRDYGAAQVGSAAAEDLAELSR